MRVLGRIRLSRLSDESTSPERQRELIEQWAEANEHEVIGWAEDLDISGSVDPFETPALGPWLHPSKLPEWDILAAWKLDRLARRAVPLHRLFGLIQDNNKTLVCVSDNIDLSTWVGRLIASVIAGVAEGELEAIKERTRSSHKKLRELGRWPGGKPFYGYQAVQTDVGWTLEHNPETKPVLDQIIQDVLAGKTVESIAGSMTVPSPSGKPLWRSQTIRKLLRSKTLLGHVTHEGATVRDSEGQPILKAPALVDVDTWNRIQAALDSTTFTKTNNRTSKASPLLGVALCFDCRKPLHHRGQTTGGKLYRYYYCRGCKGAQIRAEEVEGALEELFMKRVGDGRARTRSYVPAQDHQTERQQAEEAVAELSALLRTVQSSGAKQRILGQIDALDTRIAALEALPATKAGWQYHQADHTYKQAWEQLDTEGRRQLLLRSGFTMRIKREPGTQMVRSEFYEPEKMEQLLAAN